MGARNADLIRACEHARAMLRLLVKLVDESQAACEHPPDRRLTVPITNASWCADCSKPLP
jgi:hypothetical protein